MNVLGKTVRIYLADGTATGVRHAEIANWTGQAFACPKTRLGELSGWSESQRPGVYLLFGEDEENGLPRAYIGEAENVLIRLKNHVKNKDFWNRVIFFTSKDDNLTKAHVKYLESTMILIAKNADRILLENSNVPALPLISRSERDAMEEFLNFAQILLEALGSPILQPLPNKSSTRDTEKAARVGPLAHIKLFLDIPSRGAKGEGISTDDGFVVFAGSRGSNDTKDSLTTGWLAFRDEKIAKGDIVVKEIQIEFLKNVIFSSSSAAAAILCGRPTNGRTTWKTEDGRTLKSLEMSLSGPDSTDEEG